MARLDQEAPIRPLGTLRRSRPRKFSSLAVATGGLAIAASVALMVWRVGGPTMIRPLAQLSSSVTAQASNDELLMGVSVGGRD